MTYDASSNLIEGWMDNKELDWLYKQATGFDSIVEIGSWKGRSSHALLSGCKGTVHCVDEFKGSEEQTTDVHLEATKRDISVDFFENVGMFKNLNQIRMDSRDAFELFADDSVDMVFIDGSHTFENVKADILNWMPKAKKLLCGHDYIQSSVYAVASVTGLNLIPLNIGSLWVLKKE